MGYQINGFDMTRWKSEGYGLCYDEIREKFVQNPTFLQMLKTTSPKILVEASTDKLWGTETLLRDNDALKPEKWYNTGGYPLFYVPSEMSQYKN